MIENISAALIVICAIAAFVVVVSAGLWLLLTSAWRGRLLIVGAIGIVVMAMGFVMAAAS